MNNNSNNADALKKAAFVARGLADDASKAIGNLLPTASLQSITTRKYTLPDKTVASQVLMYRQLLHTSCRPGLKLSRPYQATAAQKAVIHMPWWEEGIETTKKMVISYDNLISRLWLNGAIIPHQKASSMASAPQPDLLDSAKGDAASGSGNVGLETYIGDDGLPPVPHEFWVGRLGFQQPDPVTDFRSGGVLSLALMVYMVESCPKVCRRFFLGDASVLPFGITCINVVDMIAKFLMLAKSTDRMDALLSQKPFWRMFGDPNAILALQMLAMNMLADVVVELDKERKVPGLVKEENGMGEASGDKVTVFDFPVILERTERRVRDDLLGAGPKTVDELKSIAGRLSVKYQNSLERRIARALQQQKYREASVEEEGTGEGSGSLTPTQAQAKVSEVMAQAGTMAGGFFAKMKETAQNAPPFQMPRRETSKPAAGTGGAASSTSGSSGPQLQPTVVAIPPAGTTAPVAGLQDDEGEWAGTDLPSATAGISNFSIGDLDDDDDDL